jgi:hypothetical protein
MSNEPRVVGERYPTRATANPLADARGSLVNRFLGGLTVTEKQH